MTFTKNRILFRADGDSRIGLGHVMRCVALSEMVSAHFQCIFIIANPVDYVKSILSNYGDVVALQASNKNDELQEMSNIILDRDIIVIDGYLFDQLYLSFLDTKGYKLVIIDDFAQGFFNSALVLNHANKSLVKLYKTNGDTKVLCGFDYLILRKEFLRAAQKSRQIKNIDTAFICFGGADPSNVTIKVLESCIKTNFIGSIIIVTGAVYSNQSHLTDFINSYKGEKNIVNYINIDASKMIDLVLNSHICICPASSIALEICCVKSGLLIGTIADNQKLIHEQLLNIACADSIGDFNQITIDDIYYKLKEFQNADKVNQMMKAQFAHIDGNSGERILNEFKLLAAC